MNHELTQVNEFNVVIENEHLQPRDVSLFFRENDVINILPKETTMADIGVLMGLFPSKSQARKNGWDGEVPNGWTEKIGIGKLRRSLWIWKPIQTID